MNTLKFTAGADRNLSNQEKDKGQAKRHKAVCQALGYLETNPRHPALKTHVFSSIKGPNGEKVFEACAENKTPAAFHIFWHYGSNKDVITIIAITTHP